MQMAIDFTSRIFLICLIATGLSGCGSLNSSLASSIADYVPEWAGGLPKDAPPRPDDPRYKKFIEEQKARAIIPTPTESSSVSSTETPHLPR